MLAATFVNVDADNVSKHANVTKSLQTATVGQQSINMLVLIGKTCRRVVFVPRPRFDR